MPHRLFPPATASALGAGRRRWSSGRRPRRSCPPFEAGLLGGAAGLDADDSYGASAFTPMRGSGAPRHVRGHAQVWAAHPAVAEQFADTSWRC